MSTHPIRKIGNVDVSAIGYGCMGLSTSYGPHGSDEERLKFLDELYASGCRHWDTADAYGDSEELLGKWFKRTGKRADIFLATKFGFKHTPDGLTINGSPEYVKQACSKSLERLGVEYIDLYYIHRADKTVPIELTIGAVAELVKEGKVKQIGISEVSEATLRRAHAVHPIAAIQVEYSPFCLDIESPSIGLLKASRELGIAIVAYSPLGRGLLTGRYKGPEDFAEDDGRRRLPRFSAANFPLINKIVDSINAIGVKHGATSGQVALAWLLEQGDDIIPIPGTQNVKYLHENLGALNVRLSPNEIKEVRALAESADFEGDRYPALFASFVLVDTPPLEG
ncbi:NADP-dependent oxidoreductase domain-containing protein [Amylostereum chailletii]|nr:NADP-dependent oxidoreductase domain-containing protein [Amylostereum chailletii]